MKLLCTGDIHIGRRSSRIPPAIDSALFSTAAAWDAIVEVAIQERVDLLALSGDVVDRSNRYFEAFGPLERGLGRLADAGIDTVAVTGNHDFDVLPQLQRGVAGERLHLLGLGGTWERWTLRRDGEPALHVDGWSFPTEHVHQNPLLGYAPGTDDGVPVLGLLHADLDASASVYAPVTRAELSRQSVALWLLGHIHHPAHSQDLGAPVMYPGSPLAMDPGETGPHGPWLVELTPGGPPKLRQVLTSRVRYEPVTIALDDVTSADDVRDITSGTLQRRLIEMTLDNDSLASVAFRVTLTGRTALHRDVEVHLKELTEDFRAHAGTCQGFVEKLVVDTRPALSLADLANRNDPPGALARTILALEAEEYPVLYRRLIDSTLTRMTTVQRATVYSAVADSATVDRASARTHLLKEGYRLLDTLIAQRETGGV